MTSPRSAQDLASRWLAALEPARPHASDARPALASAIEAHAAFSYELSPHTMSLFLATRWPANVERAPWADLVLAAGCLASLPAAMRSFTLAFAPVIRSTLRRRADDLADLEDATQRALERVLAGPSPKLAEYSGKGALEAWVKVVAVRSFLNTRRPALSPTAERDAERLFESAIAPQNPELDAIRRQAVGRFQLALRAAVDALSSDERGLLRSRFIDDVALTTLASTRGVDRATVVRQLAKTRDRLRAELERVFSEELGLAMTEVLSVGRLLRSQPTFDLEQALTSLRNPSKKRAR